MARRFCPRAILTPLSSVERKHQKSRSEQGSQHFSFLNLESGSRNSTEREKCSGALRNCRMRSMVRPGPPGRSCGSFAAISRVEPIAKECKVMVPTVTHALLADHDRRTHGEMLLIHYRPSGTRSPSERAQCLFFAPVSKLTTTDFRPLPTCYFLFPNSYFLLLAAKNDRLAQCGVK